MMLSRRPLAERAFPSRDRGVDAMFGPREDGSSLQTRLRPSVEVRHQSQSATLYPGYQDHIRGRRLRYEGLSARI